VCVYITFQTANDQINTYSLDIQILNHPVYTKSRMYTKFITRQDWIVMSSLYKLIYTVEGES